MLSHRWHIANVLLATPGFIPGITFRVSYQALHSVMFFFSSRDERDASMYHLFVVVVHLPAKYSIAVYCSINHVKTKFPEKTFYLILSAHHHCRSRMHAMRVMPCVQCSPHLPRTCMRARVRVWKGYLILGKCQNQLYLIRSSQNRVHTKTKVKNARRERCSVHESRVKNEACHMASKTSIV